MEDAADGDSLDSTPKDSLLAGRFWEVPGFWLAEEAADDTVLITFGAAPAPGPAEEDLEPIGAGGRRLRRDIFRWLIDEIGELYQLLI